MISIENLESESMPILVLGALGEIVKDPRGVIKDLFKAAEVPIGAWNKEDQERLKRREQPKGVPLHPDV